MKRFLSSRWFQFFALPLLVLLWFIATDPSNGQDTLLRLQLWAQALLITGASYLIAKAMLGRSSSEALYDRVIQKNSYAAAIAYVGICILRGTVLLGLLLFFANIQR
jgi:hypothetical protein